MKIAFTHQLAVVVLMSSFFKDETSTHPSVMYGSIYIPQVEHSRPFQISIPVRTREAESGTATYRTL